MFTSTHASNTQNTTFYFVVDNDTATAMVPILQQNCSSVLNSGVSNTLVPYSLSDPDAPKPDQAVQYCRASSAGYKNTAQLSDNTSLPDTPLPTNIDTDLLACLNKKIGVAIPLERVYDKRLLVFALSPLWDILIPIQSMLAAPSDFRRSFPRPLRVHLCN
jgi:hypothetical protein